MSRMRRPRRPGRFGLAVSGIAPKTTSFDPPLRKKSGGRRRTWATTAEGQPHVRGDVGGGGVSRRDSRSEAEGTPEGLARPRSAGGPGGARGRLRRSLWAAWFRVEVGGASEYLCNSKVRSRSGGRAGTMRPPTVKGRATRATNRATIEFQFSLAARVKRALKRALRSALCGTADGPWSAVLRSALIYETPTAGTWWWSLALISGTGTQQLLLVPPDDQKPAPLAALVAAAVRGELFTVLCAGCRRVRLKGRTWHRRPLPINLARVSHGVCPECTRRLYPQLPRHAGR
jgi:hypothetical protein